MLWTHNDSGNEPVLFALDTTGSMIRQVQVAGATLVDWEDLEAGPCDAGTCLFIGDIGDNRRARPSITIYVVPEPAPGATRTDPAKVLQARYPDGAQDAEALFVLPTGDIYLVTKGRHAGIALYRYPKAQQQSGGVATLERVRSLWRQPNQERDRVTSATASPDGRWVAVRTYRTLHLYPAAEFTGTGTSASVTFDLTPLGEKQGESVVLTNEGVVWMTSEAEKKRDRPGLSRLSCVLGPR